MIYFLVNNDYHFVDTLIHCQELKEYDKTLIQIPHTLRVLERHPDFINIFTFDTPFQSLKSLFNLSKIKTTEKIIQGMLQPSKKDILFVYTEFEILNQFIIAYFKKKGARVYVIEDGGFPTYLTYSVHSDKRLPFKQFLKLLYMKYILQYRFLEYWFFNNMVFPQIKAKYIDAVLLYINVNITRSIKKYLIRKNTRQITTNSSSAILLNEKLYEIYCSKHEYMEILDDLLNGLSKQFDNIYFKFHPRETLTDQAWQKTILQKYDNVMIVTDEAPIEQLIDKYSAKYVFSFISAALLNLFPYGITPVYVYHLYPVLKKHPLFEQTTLLLENMGYTFLENINSSVEQVGFSNMSIETNQIELRDLANGTII